jgi:hypothetical protein
MVKCHQCKKRIKNLIEIKCDCGYIFCIKHLNKHSHNCCNLSNFKLQIKKSIKKENPIVIVDKIEKI